MAKLGCTAHRETKRQLAPTVHARCQQADRVDGQVWLWRLHMQRGRDRVRLMSTHCGGWKIQMEMFRSLLLLQFEGHQKGTLRLKGGRHCNGQPEQTPTEELRVTELIQQIKVVILPSTSTMGTAPLRLPFEKVMLRRPSAPLEDSILIPEEGLKELGENVWDVQEQ
ncbi:hypothetical protein EMCG_02521 [[Emmonsia] crescens]|uniref:Uncharacterized protein n=1 Tax=[Emmonsia] crescens TaxID=73230 RepID=A0A0G2J1E4_9EURO|nr:hypothetical protein EMCG_02521 [Emmonsia crescens UAMH 3008]